MSAAFWTAVGSLATAAAALVALVSYVQGNKKSHRDRTELEARDYRTRIGAFSTAASNLTDAIQNGTDHVMAARYTALDLRSRVPSGASASDLWRLIDDGPQALSAAVAGWRAVDSDSFPDSIAARRLDFRIAAKNLPGRLGGLAAVGALIRNLETDTTGQFMKLLSDGGAALKALISATTADEVAQGIEDRLQADVATYIVVRYEDALNMIDEYVTRLAGALTELSDTELNRVARQRTEAGAAAETYTDEIRVGLGELTAVLSTEALAELDALVSGIERSITVEAAAERLQRSEG